MNVDDLIYQQNRLNFAALLELENIGLIKVSSAGNFTTTVVGPGEVSLHYFDKTILVSFYEGTRRILPIGNLSDV